MEQIIFYKPDGTALSPGEFVDYYNELYYFESSFLAEKRIEDIYKNGISSEKDVFEILAWKIGAVRQWLSEGALAADKTADLVLRRDWSYEGFRGGSRSGSFGTETFNNFLKTTAEAAKDYRSNLKNCNEKGGEEFQSILNRLNESSPENIGSVYLVTLLYFITRGAMPIYDRFAMMALDAVFPDSDGDSLRPGSQVRARELPIKSSTSFKALITNPRSRYSKYINKLNRFMALCGGDYASDRKYDRALWVYGHLFTSP